MPVSSSKTSKRHYLSAFRRDVGLFPLPSTSKSEITSKTTRQQIPVDYSKQSTCRRTRERCVSPLSLLRSLVRVEPLQLTNALSRVVKTGGGVRTRATRTSANSSSRRRAKVRDDHDTFLGGSRRGHLPLFRRPKESLLTRNRVCPGHQDARQRPSRGPRLRRQWHHAPGVDPRQASQEGLVSLCSEDPVMLCRCCAPVRGQKRGSKTRF